MMNCIKRERKLERLKSDALVYVLYVVAVANDDSLADELADVRTLVPGAARGQVQSQVQFDLVHTVTQKRRIPREREVLLQ